LIRALFVALAVVISAAVGPEGTAGQTTLRVAAYNIKHGLGNDGRVDLERVAEVIRSLDADVVTLQEVDRGAARTDGVDQTQRLAELTGMRGIFGDFRPYDGGEYGMAVLTRLPVVAVLNHRLPQAPAPISALEVQVAAGPDGRIISVVGIHLVRTPEERLAEADTLTDILENRGHPVILAGDFNSRPGDVVLQRLTRDWLVVPKEGDRFTFPADVPDREIDFIMLRPAEAFEILEHRVVNEALASDHRPLLALLRLW
jgi:endonuclease/exonuclease/phosphatase family metal-dependent hydrolase